MPPDLPSQNTRRIRSNWWVAAIGLLAAIVFWQASRTMLLNIAVQGWGPQDYVSQKLHPQDYRDNWTSGIHTYDHSLPMRAYYWLAKYANVDPSTTMFPYTFVEIALFIFAVGFLVHTLFRDGALTLLAITVALCSPMVGLNLARFDAGFTTALNPLYYGYAHALRLLAIAMFFRNRPIHGFILLALTTWCHFTIGAYTAAFIGAMMLVTPRSLLERPFVIGGAIFAALVLPHMIWIMRGASIGSGSMPVDDWINATRLFSLHFYPDALRQFSTNAHHELIPLILVSLFMLQSLNVPPSAQVPGESLLCRRILTGCGMMALLTIAGVVMATSIASPTLIKLCLHRASDLLSFFAVILMLRYLYVAIITRGLLSALLAGYTIAVLLLSKPGLCVLPVMILLGTDIWRGRLGLWALRGRHAVAARCGYVLLMMALAMVTAMNLAGRHFRKTDIGRMSRRAIAAIWEPLERFDPSARFDLVLRGGQFETAAGFAAIVAGAIALVVILRGRWPAPRIVPPSRGIPTARFAALLMLCTAAVWWIHSQRSAEWLAKNEEPAKAFLQAQRWALQSTPADSLFLLDPSQSYGWRDFSQRSSFGTHREWGMFAFMYDADLARYEEGKRRLRMFDIDLDAVIQAQARGDITMMQARDQVRSTVHDAFAGMSADELLGIARTNGIDYIVRSARQAEDQVPALSLPIVFQNDHYIIYRVPG